MHIIVIISPLGRQG